MSSKEPTTYLLPGMTADYPIFSRLEPLLPGTVVVPFIELRRSESLRSYAARMAEGLQPDSYIVGVSFGGILAQELARIVHPRGCVIIASIRGPHQLPPWFRWLQFMGADSCEKLLRVTAESTRLVPPTMRTTTTIRIGKLAGAAGRWHRWSTAAVLDWRPNPDDYGFPVLHIHGDADRTFPIAYVEPDVVITDGLHSLPVSHPLETAAAIKAFMSAT